MLDIVLGTKGMVLNKTHKICCQKEFIRFEGDKISQLSSIPQDGNDLEKRRSARMLESAKDSQRG